jgi:hypothetical protein
MPTVMPSKKTTGFEVPYCDPLDVPPSMATLSQKMAERINAVFTSIKGDATLATDGTLTLAPQGWTTLISLETTALEGSLASNTRAFSPRLFHLAPADLSLPGRTLKLRLRLQIATNETAPGGSFNLSLQPIVGSSGTAGTQGYSIGSPEVSKGPEIVTPEAKKLLTAVGSGFTAPAEGFYGIFFTNSATIAAAAAVAVSAQLQFRNE